MDLSSGLTLKYFCSFQMRVKNTIDILKLLQGPLIPPDIMSDFYFYLYIQKIFLESYGIETKVSGL